MLTFSGVLWVCGCLKAVGLYLEGVEWVFAGSFLEISHKVMFIQSGHSYPSQDGLVSNG